MNSLLQGESRPLTANYLSPRLQENREAHLSFERELHDYIASWPTTHADSIATLYEDMADKRLSPNLKAYVIVPVAAGQEDDLLARTFEQYARQTIDPSQWALLLYVNDVLDDASLLESNTIAGTMTLIEKLHAQYPHIPLRTTYTYYADKPTMGDIRASAWDVAALEMYLKGVSNNLVIGISHDSDPVWISPDYTEKMCQAASDQPDKDLFTCQLDWANVGQPHSDINRIIRYWSAMSRSTRLRQGKIDTYDANTAVRFSTYAAVGGYPRLWRTGETFMLRQRIAMHRLGMSAKEIYGQKRYQDIVSFVPNIRLKTDSRRLYQCIASGIAPDDAWTKMDFLTGNDPARTSDTLTLAAQPVDLTTQCEILETIDYYNLSKLDPITRERVSKRGRHLLSLPTVA